MEVSEWQARLEHTFGSGGIVGARLLSIIETERQCGRHLLATFHGHRVLADSFGDFYVETLEKSSQVGRTKGIPSDWRNYPYAVLCYVVNFRTLRAASTLFATGYPLGGYRLLRDLKDQAVFLAALAADRTSWSALLGTKGLRLTGEVSNKDFYVARKARKAEERRLRIATFGAESGLPPDQVAELRLWENLFHFEVHGSALTMASEGRGWLRGEQPLSIGPVFEEMAAATYMDRAGEIGWMLLRTLPFLQPSPRAFGEDWAHRWAVLDESFRFYVLSLDKLGKLIARAIVALVDAKFALSPDASYAER